MRNDYCFLRTVFLCPTILLYHFFFFKICPNFTFTPYQNINLRMEPNMNLMMKKYFNYLPDYGVGFAQCLLKIKSREKIA